ncbi:F-box protein-like [Iris pallida]|uniref:F-box protein-like n=1 Tax=Iris pallida TaxID=29817 RepID=A0AAX6H505_IRIPA|nr:F-box protein-like [Iris pallida]
MHQNHHHHHRLKSWDLLFPDSNNDKPPLNHVLLKMHHQNQHPDDQTLANPNPKSSRSRSRSRSSSPSLRRPDPTSLLPDPLLLRVLSLLPPADPSLPLVCRRWLRLHGLLRHRLLLLSLPPPSSFSLPRLLSRFPNLSHLSLLPAAFSSTPNPSPLLLSRGTLSLRLDHLSPTTFFRSSFLDSADIDSALETISQNCPNLLRISVANASGSGLLSLAERCTFLQEMELHHCTDHSLRPISAFYNLQILKLVGSVDGLYSGPGVTDIGLTILAHGCKRLVKLELSGCEGSYDGISAVGRCCPMLEELTITDHRMDPGWMAGLSFCGNLKTLRLQSCRRIDDNPGPMEHLGTCPTVETLMLQRCQLRDRRSLRALFTMCEPAREVVFQNCWGLDDEMFGMASICRLVKFLSLEGCSQLTTEGLESVIMSWPDLKSLTVVSCNSIKDDAVTPAMSSLFSTLKEFKWRPDSKSLLAMSLPGTGMGKKGGRLFKRV